MAALPSPARYLRLGLLSMAALIALPGCRAANRGLESVHQPVVQRTDYTLDVDVTDGMSPLARQQIAEWLDGLEPGYSDSLSVDDRQSPMTADLLSEIERLAARYGMRMTTPAPITNGSVPFGRIRIILSRRTAQVNGCPDWRRPALASSAGQTMSNFGCATNSNIAAMVADAADLVSGRKDRSADPNRATSKALKAIGAAGSSAADEQSPEPK